MSMSIRGWVIVGIVAMVLVGTGALLAGWLGAVTGLVIAICIPIVLFASAYAAWIARGSH